MLARLLQQSGPSIIQRSSLLPSASLSMLYLHGQQAVLHCYGLITGQQGTIG